MAPAIQRNDSARCMPAAVKPAAMAIDLTLTALDDVLIPLRTADGAPMDPELKPSSSDWGYHEPVQDVDSRDADTPDNWVPRHPQLIRLTGRHPFNCEPPLPVSYEKGYITPVSLHFVRNHGAVPKLTWGDHKVTVNGLVERPMKFSMDDLLKFPAVTVTTTVTCAGNRRKEQNMVKKTIGFNWGHSATSCGRWTGVRLCDLLKFCGIKTKQEGAHHVRYRGVVGELPQGGDGSYGTSITYTHAMDPANDVILAYKHNDRLLTPDHGYPVRMLVPGYIGGRMVKYLEEITVADTESDNHYHYFDNRVLPSHVDAELAKKEGWWYKEDFIINNMNINSAIAFPAHDEVVPIEVREYTVKGYAYSGAGRKVIRCEVSLDDAKTWRLAEIQRFEQPTEYGKHWGWVFWSIKVPMVDFLRCPEIMCRAWDQDMNTQPNTFTWNVMGMMNNCVFRVKIHPVQTTAGGLALKFEHPTLAGPTVGGWMNREEEQQAAVVQAPVVPTVPANGVRYVTMEEVEKHITRESAWFVHDNKVYDATPFLKEHPGGAESILIVAGTDATDEFNAIHSVKAKSMLKDYYIGELASTADQIAAAAQPVANGIANGITNGIVTVPTNGMAPAVPAGDIANGVGTSRAADAELVALNPRKKIAFKLIEKHELSHNVRRFRFGLQSSQHKFGLPVGKHVFLSAKVNDEFVMRAYTPTSSDDELGYFDLVIKVYWANEHPRFPEGGKMSQHLESLNVGDTIDVKGPLGHMEYKGLGKYLLDDEPHHATHLSMIAGGTGITPMYQVIKAVLKRGDDTTQMSLLYANQSPDDILLKEELDQLAAEYSNFKVWYTVDRAPAEWPFSVGFINEDMVRERLFPCSPSTACLLCGPPPMIKFACLPNLEKVGYSAAQCIQF